MVKKLYSGLLTTVLSLLILGVRPVSARDFFVSAEATYDVQDTETAYVRYEITITNARTEVYAQKYLLHLNGVYPKNVKASQGEEELQTLLLRNGETTDIEVIFPDPVIGQGSQRSFSIEFDDASLVSATGAVIEFSAPKLVDVNQFDTFLLRLRTLKDFGQVTYINPEPESQTTSDKYNVYYFSKELLTKSGVTAAYGKFQVYSFVLKYHLENPVSQPSIETIAVPADTAYQTVYISEISPSPKSMTRDDDGNWIATYELSSRQKIDVEVKGEVQVYAEPSVNDFLEDPSVYLQPTEYWQSDNPGIKALADKLKTPQGIYNYVVSNLKYSKDSVVPNATRKGAVGALADPMRSICMEFTDAFIALARAAGIPAREVNGYAYSNNSELEPLSLVSDILHSWPEYWDSSRHLWVQVDPTWENTSGADYFNQLDMNHLAFVIHGKSATKPYPPGSYKLGAYPQKDVYINLSKLPQDRGEHLTVDFLDAITSPFSKVLQKVQISNKGSRAIYNAQVEVYFDDKHSYTHKIVSLLPYGHNVIVISLPTGLLGKDLPHELKLVVDGREYSYVVGRESYIAKTLLIIFIPIALLCLIIIYKLKKLR